MAHVPATRACCAATSYDCCAVRMLMVTQDFWPQRGGIQTYSHELARRFAERCATLHLVCPAEAAERDADAQFDFPVHRVRGGSDMLPLLAAPLLTKLAFQERIDVLFHVQWQTAAAGLLLRRAGIVKKLVIAVHGKELLLRPLERAPWLQAQYDRLRVRLFEEADLVLPVSGFSGRLLQERITPRARIMVVPNGVDVSRFGALTAANVRSRWQLEGAPVILSVGRLVVRKGIDSVISCMPAILHEHPDARYVVVGEGPDQARLRALATQLGVAARVCFVGSVPDAELAGWYAAADVVVLAARDEPDSVEGFGLVLLEASACGRPTIATTAGGMAEAVVPGVTGLVVPEGDLEALQRAIESILANPVLARVMGEAGRKHAHLEHTWDRAAERILGALVGEIEPSSSNSSGVSAVAGS